MSWDEAFASRYDEWAAEMTADVPFYVELARQSEGPLVELAIGNGRVAIPVAQATGRRVIGRRTFERVAASLLPGGRFAWNAFAFDHQIATRVDGKHQDEPVPHSLHYDVVENRIDIKLDDGGTSSLWWATKNEWLGLVDVAKLEVEALYGGFDREPADDGSREYVFVTRRPS
jgi:hypothetical protein